MFLAILSPRTNPCASASLFGHLILPINLLPAWRITIGRSPAASGVGRTSAQLRAIFAWMSRVIFAACSLAKQFLDDTSPFHTGQPQIKNFEFEFEAMVVDPHQMQNRRVQIANVDDILGDVIAELIRRSVGQLRAASGQPHRKTVRVVITTVLPETWALARMPAGPVARVATQTERFSKDTLPLAGESDAKRPARHLTCINPPRQQSMESTIVGPPTHGRVTISI